jgi:hypothetical protein
MTSFRQIEANRRNAIKSTGPNTKAGKDRSRRNAVRHGLCAETVIGLIEPVDDYRAFEASVIADYEAQTAVERELVLRLASLLWRLRRATSIETELLTLHAEIVREGRHARQRETRYSKFGVGLSSVQREGNTDDDSDDRPTKASDPTFKLCYQSMHSARDLAHSFQRLANLDNGAFDRLSRYESRLWRQFVQTLLCLRSARIR